LLDGFPRKASQAVLLDNVLEKHGDELNLVAFLDVPDDVIIERIQDRWVHPPSGRVYNSTFNPPKVEGIDDVTGEPLVKRPDDTLDIIKKRLLSFHIENYPLLAHYSSETVETEGSGRVPKLVTVAGTTSDEITPQLKRVIEERFPNLPLRTSV